MSLFALKILPACPSTLLDSTFISLFSAETGLLLANVRGSLGNDQKQWNGKPFSDSEHSILRDSIFYLNSCNAIIDYDLVEDNESSSSLTSICEELRNKDRLIECAIKGEDELDIAPDVESLFFTKKEFLRKRKYLHKHLTVNRTPSQLAEIMTPYVFKCCSFKLIDPYMFEMNKHNVVRRLDFLVETCEQIKKFNTLPRDEISIEVIGRSYFFDKDRKRQEIKPSKLKETLSYDRRLRALSKEFDIRFIGLDDYIYDFDDAYTDGEPNEKIHKRFFYTDKYLISLEYPFETKENDQNTIWFGQEYRRSEIARDYRENSDSFTNSFGFFADEFL